MDDHAPLGVGFTRIVWFKVVEDLRSKSSGSVRAFFVSEALTLVRDTDMSGSIRI